MRSRATSALLFDIEERRSLLRELTTSREVTYLEFQTNFKPVVDTDLQSQLQPIQKKCNWNLEIYRTATITMNHGVQFELETLIHYIFAITAKTNSFMEGSPSCRPLWSVWLFGKFCRADGALKRQPSHSGRRQFLCNLCGLKPYKTFYPIRILPFPTSNLITEM